MPTFEYEAITTSGRARRGSIAAASRADATRQLLQRGETATSLVASSDGRASQSHSTGRPASRRASRPNMKKTEVAALMRELATALEAGLPLMQALRTIRKQASGRAAPVGPDHRTERVGAGESRRKSAT